MYVEHVEHVHVCVRVCEHAVCPRACARLPRHTGPARSWRGRPEGPWEPAPRHVLASRSRAAPTSGGTKAMGAPCAESLSPSPAGRLVPGEHPSAERGLRRIPEQEALGAPAPRREPDPGLRVHFAVTSDQQAERQPKAWGHVGATPSDATRWSPGAVC